MNGRKYRFWVGLFVLAGIILLAVLSVMFTNFANVLKSHDEYTILFKDVPGVAPGTPVRRSGIRIGQVKSLTLDEETGDVHVVVMIDKGHRIRKSEQPTLVRGLLGSDPSIDFVPRRPDGEPIDRSEVQPGSEVVGALGQDIRNLLNQTSELVPSTQETLNDIRKSIQSFEKLAPKLDEAIREYQRLATSTRELLPEIKKTNEEILVTSRNWGKVGERMDVLLQTNQEKLIKALDNFNETVVRVGNLFNEENQRNLSTTLKNVRAGSDNLESISKNTDALLRQSQQTIDRVNQAVTKSDDVLTNLQKATKPMADRSASVMKNLDESTDKLNRALTEARETLRAFGQGNGTFRRFLDDPALYNNLNDAAVMLVRIMPRLDRILHDLEVFADKVARHPESLGVGGVVSPSGGLKEAPSSSGGRWPRHP
jgi:phospholipid/cholesterol/gamma-HCH transport system substrate-binding protein